MLQSTANRLQGGEGDSLFSFPLAARSAFYLCPPTGRALHELYIVYDVCMASRREKGRGLAGTIRMKMQQRGVRGVELQSRRTRKPLVWLQWLLWQDSFRLPPQRPNGPPTDGTEWSTWKGHHRRHGRGCECSQPEAGREAGRAAGRRAGPRLLHAFRMVVLLPRTGVSPDC